MITLPGPAAPPPPPCDLADVAAGLAQVRGELARLAWLVAHPPAPPVSGYVKGRY